MINIVAPHGSDTALRYSRAPERRETWLRELSEFIAFPSISAIPTHRRDVEAAAGWLARHMRDIGLRNARVLPGIQGGAPSVYADWLLNPGKPTLLIYGHYDVQPVDPVRAWRNPPFKATIIGPNLYARGASDDKGQLFIHLKALEAYLRTGQPLPVNVKVWLEGEEEINSPTLPAFLSRQAALLHADAVVVSDTEMVSPDCPSLIYGLRGALSAELEVSGPAHDLHSGRYGGGVHNPLQALCEILAGFHDRRGRVAIRGFYDQLAPHVSQTPEVGGCACCRSREQHILRDLDIPMGWGDPDYTLEERMTSRPALIINGVQGGYNGPGVKAVIPSRSSARFSFRLVPNQSPEAVMRLLKQHLSRVAPPTVRLRLKGGAGCNPVILPVKHPVMKAAGRALRKTWGRAPVFTRSGGSIPAVTQFVEHLQCPIVLMGFGLPDDDIHAPNEKISLPQFFRGVETVIHFLSEYGHS